MASSRIVPAGVRRFDVLDGLRGACACLVALYHMPAIGWIGRSGLVRHGYLFVDFFFVLSGLVIALSYRDKLRAGFPAGSFMLLRLGRTWPLHAAMMFVFLVYNILAASAGLRAGGRGAFDPPDDLRTFLLNLLLVQIFAGPPGVTWNVPSWSIAAETWTYLVFALLFRRAGRALLPVAGAFAVAAPLYLLWRGEPHIAVVHDGALVRALFGFALGVLAAPLVGRIGSRLAQAPMIATVAEIAMAAAVIAFVRSVGTGAWSVTAPFLFCAAVLTFSAEAGLVSRLLRRRPFLRLGLLSYSIYMVHFFIEDRVFSLLAIAGRVTGLPLLGPDGRSVAFSPLFADAVSLGTLAIVVGIAGVTFRWIEQPCQRWSRRRVLAAHPQLQAVRGEARVPSF